MTRSASSPSSSPNSRSKVLEQLAVLVLGRDDLDVEVQLLAQQAQRVVIDRLGGRDHLAELEHHGDQVGRRAVDPLGEVGQRGAAGQPDDRAVAAREPHATDRGGLHVLVLLALGALGLPALRRATTGATEGAGRSAATGATGTTTTTGTTRRTSTGTAGTVATGTAGTRTGTSRAAGTEATGAAAGTCATGSGATRTTGSATGTTGTCSGTAGTCARATGAAWHSGTDRRTRGHRARVGTRATGAGRGGRTRRRRRTGRGRGRATHAGTGEGVVPGPGPGGRAAHAGAPVGVVARTRTRSRARGRATRRGRVGAGLGGSTRPGPPGPQAWQRRPGRRVPPGLSGRRVPGRWALPRSPAQMVRQVPPARRRLAPRARLRGRRLGGGPPRGRAPRWLGCRGLGREGLTQLALDRGLDRRGRRLHILTVRVEPRHGVLAGNPQLLGQCADPDLRHFSPRLGPSPWCLSGHGPLVAGGHAHSSELIECSFPFRSSTVEVRSVVVCRSCLDPLADSRGVERSRDPQGPWERPAPLRQIQAADGRMQVRTTTGLPGPGIREAQAVPGGDPKQFGLDCPYPTGDARSRRPAVRSRRIRV